MIAIIGDETSTACLTIGFKEYIAYKYLGENTKWYSVQPDFTTCIETVLNNNNVSRIYVMSGDEYLQDLIKINNQYGLQAKKISTILHRPLSYEVLSIASFYSRFILLTLQGYKKFFGLKNVDFLPHPTINIIDKREKLTVPTLTFCGSCKKIPVDMTHEHNRYNFYLTLAQSSHNLPCEYLYNNEEQIDDEAILEQRQKATHNVLFLDEWYESNAASSFMDSFTYLLPVVAPANLQYEFYRNGLDIGFICANAEQMLANVHYLSVNFDNNRYMQQIENLRFIREYFSGKTLAQRYNV